MALNDGIVSLATSLGQKAEHRTFFGGRKLSDKVLADLYENNWLVKKYIDVRTSDMTRLDREVLTPDFDAELYESASRRLGAFKAREDSPAYASLYGDSLLIAITDEQDLSKPVDFEVERIQRFIVLDKTGYDFDELDDDILSANYGNPRMYWLTSDKDTLIHNSRVCRTIAGRRSTKQKSSRLAKYGTSDIQAIKDPLFNFLTVCANIFDIVEESKSDVLYIEDFNASIAAGREEDFVTLAKSMNLIKSSTGILMLDGKARWEQKELTFAGLTDIWNQARTDLSGAFETPLTILFGQSASGFESGEENSQNYYQNIASLQENRLRPIDTFIDKFILRDIGFDGDGLDFKYPSIELSNDVEKSTILSAAVTALTTLLTQGVLSEPQVAKELKNMDLLPTFTEEDMTQLEELISESEAEDQTAQIEGGEAEQASGGLLSQTARPAY